MRNFFSNLNIRQLIIHFAACWLFIYAFHTLAYLYDYKFINGDYVNQYKVIFKERYNTDLFIINTAGSIGLFIAYTISWRISVKHDWFWATPGIIFVSAFALYYFNILGWGKLQYIFLAPGQIFLAINSIITTVVNGTLMLAIGLFLFFNQKIVAYINRGEKTGRLL